MKKKLKGSYVLRIAHIGTKKTSYLPGTEKCMKILVVSQLANGCLKNHILKGQFPSEL